MNRCSSRFIDNSPTWDEDTMYHHGSICNVAKELPIHMEDLRCICRSTPFRESISGMSRARNNATSVFLRHPLRLLRDPRPGARRRTRMPGKWWKNMRRGMASTLRWARRWDMVARLHTSSLNSFSVSNDHKLKIQKHENVHAFRQISK
jgi:hypothetical protein